MSSVASVVATSPPNRNAVERRTFRDAKEFLDALHPLASHWRSNPLTWVFRGNSDASRSLVPSAHRRRSWKEFGWSLSREEEIAEKAGESDLIVVGEQREIWLYERYVLALNDAGLTIPAYDPSFPQRRQKVLHYHSTLDAWPKNHQIPALALAQHYGLPTRERM